MQLTNTYIIKQLEVFNTEKEKLRQVIIEAQCACNHEHIAEHDAYPPIRICLHCGITEAGWGCGYILLKNKSELGIPSIKLDLLTQLRQGFFLNDHDKGPVLRKEIRINELIRNKS